MHDPDEAAWDEAAARHEEALALAADGSIDDAHAAAEEALAGLRAALGDEHPDVGNAYDTLAEILVAQGRTSEALALWPRALAAFDAWPGEEIARRMRLPVAQHFAMARALACDFDGARALVDECIEQAAQLHGPAHPEVAAGWNLRGVVAKFTGRYDEAEAAYAQALARLGGEADAPAWLLHNLAGLACARGDFARAEATARAALAKRDGDPLGAASDRAGLADALAGLGRPREAAAAYREAIDAYEAAGRAQHPEVACFLQNLADALADAGDGDEAVRCYRAAIARKEACYGPDHPEVGAALASLAGLLAEQGSPEAAPLARRAVAIAASLDEGHPLRAGCEAVARRLAAGG